MEVTFYSRCSRSRLWGEWNLIWPRITDTEGKYARHYSMMLSVGWHWSDGGKSYEHWSFYVRMWWVCHYTDATCQTNYSKTYIYIYNLILERYVHQKFKHCIWDMKKKILTKTRHFLQKCSLLPRMPYFLFNMLEKEKKLYSIYNGFDSCNAICIILL